MIMGVEKSHALLSASWRTKNGGGVTQSKDLRTGGVTGVSGQGVSPNPRLKAREPELIS